MFCKTLIVQVLYKGDSFTLVFNFTLFGIVKEAAVYIGSHFKNSEIA